MSKTLGIMHMSSYRIQKMQKQSPGSRDIAEKRETLALHSWPMSKSIKGKYLAAKRHAAE